MGEESFRLRLRHTTPTDVRVAVEGLPGGRPPDRPAHRIRVDGDQVVLRYRGRGRFDSPWTLTTRMHVDGSSTVLTGGFSTRVEGLLHGVFAAGGLMLLGFAVVIGVEAGAVPEMFLCLAGGLLLVLIAVVRVAVGPSLQATQAFEAEHLLRALLEQAPPPRVRRGLWRWMVEGSSRRADD